MVADDGSGGNASDGGDGSGSNASDGEWQVKLRSLARCSPPAVRPGSQQAVVPNRPWTAIGPWPGGWEPLL